MLVAGLGMGGIRECSGCCFISESYQIWDQNWCHEHWSFCCILWAASRFLDFQSFLADLGGGTASLPCTYPGLRLSLTKLTHQIIWFTRLDFGISYSLPCSAKAEPTEQGQNKNVRIMTNGSRKKFQIRYRSIKHAILICTKQESLQSTLPFQQNSLVYSTSKSKSG